MAQMIPKTPDHDTPHSERKVFEILQKELPKEWTVIHARRFVLPGGRRVKEGEVDFIVLDPSRGFLGLEVRELLEEKALNLRALNRSTRKG